MWPFVLLGVRVCAGQRISLARNPLKGPNGEIFRETRSGRGKEGPREDRGAVDKGRQRCSRQRRAEEDGRPERAVQGKDGQQKEAVREDSQR